MLRGEEGLGSFGLCRNVARIRGLEPPRSSGVRNLVRAGVPRCKIGNEADLMKAAEKLAAYTSPIAPKLPLQK